jgi:branched-chain amino acid transport system ATP-binding protein
MSFLEAKKISILFGGLAALRDVTFEINQGEVFSIIGPNGAGKTTIFNCINRYYDLYEGEIFFKGHNITSVSAHVVADLGIARTFQNTELFRNNTVVDNLLLGRHRHRRTNVLKEAFFTRSVRDQEITSREKVETIIDFLDLKAYRNRIVASLPYGIQKIVELGRALAMEPDLLLLDEPSSGMSMEETEDIAFWISDIKEEWDVTIIIVEHDMKLVKELSDRVLALNFGVTIAQGQPEEVLDHPAVIKAYLGEKDAFTQA